VATVRVAENTAAAMPVVATAVEEPAVVRAAEAAGSPAGWRLLRRGTAHVLVPPTAATRLSQLLLSMPRLAVPMRLPPLPPAVQSTTTMIMTRRRRMGRRSPPS